MPNFKRRMGAERTMLMLPLNVVMVARVEGPLNAADLAEAMEKLRARHRLLAVRVRLENDDTAWYVDNDVPPVTVTAEERRDDVHWLEKVKAEYRKSFPIETGPLIRCSVLTSNELSEIILCGHHAICDGLSMGYLLRDLLYTVMNPNAVVSPLPDPPPIDSSTVPNPKEKKSFVKLMMNIANNKWKERKVRFTQNDMLGMHEEYWKKNSSIQLEAWELDAESTKALVERCREEGVTVNSALWAAFLAAQYEVQYERKRYQKRSGLAVNTRGKLRVPVGEALGFYASSLTVKLPYRPKDSFWQNARRIHERIGRSLAKTDIFRMLFANLLHPTLLDSLYFSKYSNLDGMLPRKILRKLKWHDVTYGYAITNVGRQDIPTEYGPLKIQSVFGPTVFSDVDEKVVGVITVGGKMSFLLACNEAVTGHGTAGRLREVAMRKLTQSIARKCELPLAERMELAKE